MPFLPCEHGRLFYRHWQARQPRGNVVVLHGFGENSMLFHRLAVRLTWSGFDVWALDHAGHGLSHDRDGRIGSIADLVRDAAALLAVVRASSRLPKVLVGHSMGAVAGAMVALGDRGLSGLVLAGAPIPAIPEAAARASDVVFSEDAFYLDALANDPVSFNTAKSWDDLCDAIAAVGPHIQAGLRTLPTPTLFINGELDVYAPPSVAQALADEMPNAQAWIVPGGHHDIVNDVEHLAVEGCIIAFAQAATGGQPASAPHAATDSSTWRSIDVRVLRGEWS